MKIDSKLHRIYVKRSKTTIYRLIYDDCFEAEFNHKNHKKSQKWQEICPKSLGRSVVPQKAVFLFPGYNPEISGLMKSAGRNFRVNLVEWEENHKQHFENLPEIT